MICTFISRFLGFLRIAVIGAIFGASGTADVINAVFNIPNNLRKLFAEGALSSAFIPILSDAIVKDATEERAKKIARNILSFLLIVLVPLVILAFIFSDQIVNILLSFDDPQKMEQSRNLFKWVFSYILFISLSAAFMGVLNSKEVFVIPAITPILFSISVIVGIILLHQSLGIFSLAVGIIVGGLAQIIFQIPCFLKRGYDLKPDFKFNNSDFKKILKQWLPVVGSASIFTVNQIFAFFFASGLEDGSASALQYAVVFFHLPLGIFSISIITVLFPRMSRRAAVNDITSLRETLNYGLRFLLLLLVPSSIVLILLGKDIITVALERGSFTQAGTIMTYHVLIGFSYGLFSTGALNLFQRFFYSRQDYVTPIIVAAIILFIDVGLSLLLKETALRVTGLAVANTIAFSIGLIIIFLVARKKIGSLNERKLLITSLKIIITSIMLIVVILAYKHFIQDIWNRGIYIINLLLTLGICVLCTIITIGLYLVLRVDIAEDIIKRRLMKRGSR